MLFHFVSSIIKQWSCHIFQAVCCFLNSSLILFWMILPLFCCKFVRRVNQFLVGFWTWLSLMQSQWISSNNTINYFYFVSLQNIIIVLRKTSVIRRRIRHILMYAQQSVKGLFQLCALQNNHEPSNKLAMVLCSHWKNPVKCDTINTTESQHLSIVWMTKTRPALIACFCTYFVKRNCHFDFWFATS